MDWQPFESAPKDGSKILLLGAYGHPYVAWWGDINKADEGFVDDYEPRFCWIGNSDGKNNDLFLRLDHIKPALWAPIPEPSQ